MNIPSSRATLTPLQRRPFVLCSKRAKLLVFFLRARPPTRFSANMCDFDGGRWCGGGDDSDDQDEMILVVRFAVEILMFSRMNAGTDMDYDGPANRPSLCVGALVAALYGITNTPLPPNLWSHSKQREWSLSQIRIYYVDRRRWRGVRR